MQQTDSCSLRYSYSKLGIGFSEEMGDENPGPCSPSGLDMPLRGGVESKFKGYRSVDICTCSFCTELG